MSCRCEETLQIIEWTPRIHSSVFPLVKISNQCTTVDTFLLTNICILDVCILAIHSVLFVGRSHVAHIRLKLIKADAGLDLLILLSLPPGAGSTRMWNYMQFSAILGYQIQCLGILWKQSSNCPPFDDPENSGENSNLQNMPFTGVLLDIALGFMYICLVGWFSFFNFKNYFYSLRMTCIVFWSYSLPISLRSTPLYWIRTTLSLHFF